VDELVTLLSELRLDFFPLQGLNVGQSFLVSNRSFKHEALTFREILGNTFSNRVFLHLILADAKHGLETVLHIFFGACKIFRNVVEKVSQAPIEVRKRIKRVLFLLSKVFDKICNQVEV